MSECVVQPEQSITWLYYAVVYFLFFGGLLAALFLGIFLFRHPVNKKQLTRRIRRRAFSLQQLMFLFSIYSLIYLMAAYIHYMWPGESSSFNLSVLLVIDLFMIFTIIGINQRNKKTWANQFGMSWSESKNLFFSPLVYLAVIPFIMVAGLGSQYLLSKIYVEGTPIQQAAKEIVHTQASLKIVYILTAIFVAAIYEEVFFRGILFPILVRFFGRWNGIIFVSGTFALIHLHPPSLVPLFLLSVVLCYAYWRTGSLWISIGIHAVFNSVAIFKLLY